MNLLAAIAPILGDTSKFWSLTAAGITHGAVIALAALGFLITQKATGVVNFAQGDLLTLGAYTGVWLINEHSWPILPGYGGAIAFLFVIGVVMERLAYAPLRNYSIHVVIIATLGAAIVLRSLIHIWQGTDPMRLQTPLNGSWTLGGAVITHHRVLILIVTVVAVAALIWLFDRTSFGRQVRALASDPETARLNGVRVNRMSMLAFGLSAALAGLGGVLIAPAQTSFDITIGFGIMLGGFAAAILGGFGSLTGVVVAGFLIGLVEELFGGYVLRDFRAAYPFLLMILVIAFKPEGLFSTGSHERL